MADVPSNGFHYQGRKKTRSPLSAPQTCAYSKVPSPEAKSEDQGYVIPEKDDLALEKVHLDKSSGANPFASTGKAWR